MDLRTNISLSEFFGFSDTKPAEIADLIASATRVCFSASKVENLLCACPISIPFHRRHDLPAQ